MLSICMLQGCLLESGVVFAAQLPSPVQTTLSRRSLSRGADGRVTCSHLPSAICSERLSSRWQEAGLTVASRSTGGWVTGADWWRISWQAGWAAARSRRKTTQHFRDLSSYLLFKDKRIYSLHFQPFTINLLGRPKLVLVWTIMEYLEVILVILHKDGSFHIYLYIH